MNRMKILLSAVLVFAATASIAQDFSDPRYAPWGDTPEQRKQNILTSNLLKEAVDTRDYDAAAVYFRTLAQEAPSAFEATFIRGAQVYSNKVQRAQDLNEKKALLDSLMMIYDLRVQYFPSSPNYGTAYVLDRKAREYLTFNPSDREGVRKLYKEAIEAGLQSDAVLDEYARLAPIFESDAPGVKEAKTQFDTCFAGSGAADCENLEKMFRPRIEAAPEDMELLKQTVSLMSRSQCSSEFFLQIAEKYYAMEPSAQTAMMLAQGFQERGDFAKSTTYLREAIAAEQDAVQKELLLVRLSMTELAAKNPTAAAVAANEAKALNPNNGMAYFALAQAYAASAASCSGLEGQAIFWVAYDTMTQAANLLANDADAGNFAQTARDAAANYRRGFPTAEECFFNELMEGARYTITCGPARGIVTTVRPR